MEAALEALKTLPLPLAAALFLAENLLIIGLALAAGALGARWFAKRRVSPPPPPLSGVEIALAVLTVLINTAVTFVGFWLFRRGVIHIRGDVGPRVILDVFVLLFAMDALMYALHRAAHLPFVYPLAHALHHRYERVRPLTLFVLHPIETFGFGSLWLALITVYDASLLGMSIYLTLNVAFGLIGHLGVEPLPASVLRLPVMRHVAMSGFHAKHHLSATQNFGFYTSIWDRLFGTLERR
jgi:lathosterol oxidase